eukprot:390258_1
MFFKYKKNKFRMSIIILSLRFAPFNSVYKYEKKNNANCCIIWFISAKVIMFINGFGFTFGIMQSEHYRSMVLKYWVNIPGANFGLAILIPVFSIMFINIFV